jgi:hypothetical protein
MACDDTRVVASLTASGVALTGSIGTLGAAALANNSLFGVGASPPLVVASAVLGTAAVAGLVSAGAAAQDYLDCWAAEGRTVERCRGALRNFLTNLEAEIVVLGIQVSATWAIVGVSIIPWAGAVPMYVIIGSLIVQLGLIASLIAFYTAFRNCLDAPLQVGTREPSRRQVSALTLAGLSMLMAIRFARWVRSPKKRRPGWALFAGA